MAAITARYPLPDRSSYTPNHVRTPDAPELDIGWDEGILEDGRPWRAEAWATDGVSALTFFLSTRDLEDATGPELAAHLERAGLVRFLTEAAREWVEARTLQDAAGEPMWSVNFVVGDEESRFLDDALSLKPHPALPASAAEDGDEPAEPAPLLRALRFAADRHRFQRRKGKDASPYINHPIAVAETLAHFGVTDQVTLQAALLHDTLEDTETLPRELEEAFDARVRDVVAEVTDDKRKPKDMRKELQRLRAPRLSRRARLIRIADKISNVTDVWQAPPESWPLERRLQYLDWTEGVVAGCRGVNPALEARYDEVLAGARAALARGAEQEP